MKFHFLLIVPSLIWSCTSPQQKQEATEQIVNVYTQRHYDADEQVFKMFTEKTGIKVNVVKAGADELINRLEMEGENSPADLFITVDAARLNRAKSKGLLAPVEIATQSSLPVSLSDPDKMWYPITYRARVIAYKKATVQPADLSTYEDLADPKWKSKLLIRSSSSGYNQSLMANLIFANGAEAARTWSAGIAANMAQEPKGGDRDQIKTIASGIGEVAVVNTYYVGIMLNSENPEEVAAAQQVGIFFPNQADRGTHINVSGVGLTKNAPNKANAIKLMEYLTGEEAQTFFAAQSFEYPANKNVKMDSTVAAFGEFKYDNLDFAADPALSDQAVKIFDETGWK